MPGIRHDFQKANEGPSEYIKENWQQTLLGFAMLGAVFVAGWMLGKKTNVAHHLFE